MSLKDVARIAQEGADSKSSSSIAEAAAVIVFNTLLFILIFGMSATVNVSHIKSQLKNKSAIAIGLGMQFFIMPFLGFLSVRIFSPYGMTSAMGIMLLIVTSSPGGTLSNWFSSTFNAELSLSVAITSIGTIMSSFMLPANLLLYSHAVYGSRSGSTSQEQQSVLKSIDFTALFVSLGVVVGGIVAGLCASWKMHSPKFSRRVNQLGTFAGLLLVIVSLFITNRGEGGGISAFWKMPWSYYVGTALPCPFSLVISTSFALLAKLRKPEVVAIGIEVCYQNINLATASAVTMFSGEQRTEALLVPLYYAAIQAFATLGYVLAAWKWGWTNPPNAKFRTVTAKIYDKEDTEGDKSEYIGEVTGDNDFSESVDTADVEMEAVFSATSADTFPNCELNGTGGSRSEQSHLIGIRPSKIYDAVAAERN